MTEPIGVFTGKQCTGYGDFARIDWTSGEYPEEGTKLYAEPQPDVSQRERYENLVAQTQAAIASLNPYVKYLEFIVGEQRKRIAELEREKGCVAVMDSSAPDCGQCTNRGRTYTLSEESSCHHCVWEKEGWRKNLFELKENQNGAS